MPTGSLRSLKPLSKSLIGSSLSLLALALVMPTAQASPWHHRHHRHFRHVIRRRLHKLMVQHVISPLSAENGLIGIHLFDSSEHVIGTYGSPDDIQPLTFGTTQQSGGFGGGAGFGGAPGGAGGFPGGPGGFPGGRGGGPGGPAGRPGSMGPAGGGGADIDSPDAGDLRSQFDFGDPFLQRGGMRLGGGPGGPTGMPGGVGGPAGRPGGMGMPGGFPGAGGRPGGGFPGAPGGGFPGAPGGPGGRGAGAPGGGATESVTYTRWIYNRDNNKFAFVINRLGQVIQIEAIGLSNPRVKTKRGIGFGSHFGNVVKAYHNPDGYDIGGDNILVKYLVHDKVAFRLTRIGDKQPHQVTGIVVSAGKG
jgi:hypothetical protein